MSAEPSEERPEATNSLASYDDPWEWFMDEIREAYLDAHRDQWTDAGLLADGEGFPEQFGEDDYQRFTALAKYAAAQVAQDHTDATVAEIKAERDVARLASVQRRSQLDRLIEQREEYKDAAVRAALEAVAVEIEADAATCGPVWEGALNYAAAIVRRAIPETPSTEEEGPCE